MKFWEISDCHNNQNIIIKRNLKAVESNISIIKWQFKMCKQQKDLYEVVIGNYSGEE